MLLNGRFVFVSRQAPPCRKAVPPPIILSHICHPMMKKPSHVMQKAGSVATSTAALEWNCRQLDLNARTRTENKQTRHHVLETFLRDNITSPLRVVDKPGICAGWVDFESVNVTVKQRVPLAQRTPKQSLSRHRLRYTLTMILIRSGCDSGSITDSFCTSEE